MTTLESTSERLEAALRRLAVEASDLFQDVLDQGAKLPFEIEPSDEGPLPMYEYTPRTGEFISAHRGELRRLEAFVEVRELAGEEAAVGFLVGLWEGKGEFDLVEDHLRGAIDGVLATRVVGEETDAGEVIVPLIGFHMPCDEIELDGVRIVRADTVDDVPVDAIEATRPAGKGNSGFLAQVRCATAGVVPTAAVGDDIRRALRAMRLFRPGAVGISTHGWVRRTGGWERFGTNANRPRHGGYRLTGNEAADLEQFSRTLASRGARMPALDWAISRFDLGAERASLVEALSDYLLALRGLLEGGGTAKAALGARVAALAAEPAEREQTRVSVERALAIERKLMSGSRFVPAAGAQPLEVIAELEDLLRRILRSMVAGELGGDLRVDADRILLADGLRAGEAATKMDETAEWTIPEPVGEEIEVLRVGEPEPETEAETRDTDLAAEEPARIVVDDVELPALMADDSPKIHEPAHGAKDWFAAPDGDGEVDWPSFAGPRRAAKEDKDERASGEHAERVRYLFPVPDSTDWDVGELRYERKKRAE